MTSPTTHEHGHENGTPDLQERLHDPETARALNRLLDRLDTVERAVATIERLEAQWPAALNVAADTLDDELTRAADRGVVFDERAREALSLAEKLTEPDTAAALERLLRHTALLEQFASLADRAPDLLATVVDVLDAEYARAAQHGHDPERALHQAVGALGKLGELLQSDEFQALLDSGVLDPKTLNVVGALGTALADTQDEAARNETPSHGLFGLLGALRDPDVQHALGFLTTVAQKFGRRIRR
jgi:hypothetical protein